MYKMIGSDGREYGPVTVEQLRQWMSEGRINGQTLVQPIDSTGWQPLSSIPELSGPPPAIVPTSPPLPPAAGKTCGLAIASLVLGCLGFCTWGLTSLVGLILGIIGLNKINKSGGTIGGQGLAIAGISISGVTLVMIPLLAALAIPGFVRARNQSQGRRILNEVRQMDAAIDQWALENGKHDGDPINIDEAAKYLKSSWKTTDLLNNAYIIGVVGPDQIKISQATKQALSNTGIDWGTY